jgi:uncharacterized membrane protein
MIDDLIEACANVTIVLLTCLGVVLAYAAVYCLGWALTNNQAFANLFLVTTGITLFLVVVVGVFGLLRRTRK